MVYEGFTMVLNPLDTMALHGRKPMAGRYLEEFEPGQVIRHQITRTVTESDNIQFSMMTMNPQPMHIDFDFAAKSEFGKPLMNSLFTLGLMIGITVHDTTLGTIVANLGMTDVAFPHPLFHGDTIRVETEVKGVRTSRSKPDRGIVEMEHSAYNQHGDLVARCLRQTMIYRKPA